MLINEDFVIRVAARDINDVWKIAEDIERAIRRGVVWTITAYWKNDYFLSGQVYDETAVEYLTREEKRATA